MRTSSEIKRTVMEKYSEIAQQKNNASKPGCGCCEKDVYNIMADDYGSIEGYREEANLGLGCGLPTEFARIMQGNTVIDLGSGAGNDCFIAREETGEKGKVIGIDMTEAMINRARLNAEKLGFNNIEFRLGEIENLPVSGDIADVVISNCVLNLVPDKKGAFAEIYRVLKPDGHFSISDIVLKGQLSKTISEIAELYAGCISGALQKEDYMKAISEAGFSDINIQKEKRIDIPDELLSKYISRDEIDSFRKSGVGIYSITVYAEKKQDDCCDKETCCK